MADQTPRKFEIEGVPEYWFRSGPDIEVARLHKPAVLVECTINFRSLRAGLNYSEERNYTAWLPESDLAIDWDTPAAIFNESSQLVTWPNSNFVYHRGNYTATAEDLQQYANELTDKLARSERLRIFFNPVFGLFSAPGDGLEHFLDRVAEAALGRVEPELRRLRTRFELHFEQVREAHSARGLSAEDLGERLLSQNLRFFESENRLAAMFSTLAGSVFGTTKARPEPEPYNFEEVELSEDLDRIEQEASEALRALYSEYLIVANEYDTFEIGLQHNNVQPIRRALLWVPVTE